MKHQLFNIVLTISVLVFTSSVQAHDPKEHMKEVEKPNCESMKADEHSKMDMKDPVIQAMMKKCQQEMKHDQEDIGSEYNEHGSKTEGTESSKKHQH
ncbi:MULTISPECIES: hypothetical protein [Kangiella]|uniref:Secreted protein n=1 Tax=Kangiella koreensis (strain DSM 16069 / JCM 12317 / KCTC 12182 / SW-125) TaxID=523791 RepID=C7RBR7_KANKD|nr:hypothetical protein [Kangiella koreensis]ACV26709.1 conserved hypothetical protein [Kangiella koreensis DSM 16069]